MNSSNKDWFETVAYEIEVIEAAPCRAFHKVGQKFLLNDYTTPEGICIESFHGMYPLLFSGRVGSDFKQLRSESTNQRIYNCPSRVVKFQVTRFNQCNNCGEKTELEDLLETKKEYDDYSLDILVCRKCLQIITHERIK